MGESRYFTATDGIRIHYTIDDFAPPWKPRGTVLLLHAAMGSMIACTPGCRCLRHTIA
jgi:alpha-beta hydrolase superfamily lysophospholipase